MEHTRLIGFLFVAAIVIFGIHWINSSTKTTAMQKEREKQMAIIAKKEIDIKSDTGKREYVLEVIGIGATFEKYRQISIWDALQKGDSYTSIREQDPKKYPWSENDKGERGGSRSFDALENGANFTPLYWGVPSFYAGPPIEDPEEQPEQNDPMPGLVAGASTNGMAWHLFAIAPWKLDEYPEKIMANIFDFFDAHPDVPYIVLTSDDSMARRNTNRNPLTPSLLKDGYYIPDRPDTAVTIILARRERVESLRPYLWDDPENNFGQEQVRAMYYDLMEKLPTRLKARYPNFHITRQPTVAEWLPAAAAFAQRSDIRGVGLHMLDNFNPWDNRPPKDWKPTPWFPVPWSRAQMAAFDSLPSFGFIHRPVFVPFSDEQGHPVKRRDQRHKLLDAGWQRALQTLPEAERTNGPARIIAATGNSAEQLLMLHGMLDHYAAQGGPEIDTGKNAQFIHTDKRLGNTGAATFFMQMAIGVMGSYRAGGASAAINLRDPNEASIVFITPPPDAVRQRQDQHGDIFRSRIVPAIDPDNYAAPDAQAILEATQSKQVREVP